MPKATSRKQMVEVTSGRAAAGRLGRNYRVQISTSVIVSLLAAAVSSNPTWSAGTAPSPSAPPGSDATALVSTSSMTASDYAQCVSDLARKKIVFEQPGEVAQQGCHLSGAVAVIGISTPFGDVAIPAKPIMLCGFGQRFSGWVRDVAAPMILAYTGQRLTQIEAGPGFACTARYDKPGSVPSEHAKGNAIDVTSFVLADDRRISVKEQSSDVALARTLVTALRTTACGYFTTVLGPGIDPAHEAHLHFDNLVHGASPNYRICE
jgi:hypothetical protein